MEVQPREAGGGEGKSSDEIAFELADMIKERIMMKIDPDDAHPSLLRVCEEHEHYYSHQLIS